MEERLDMAAQIQPCGLEPSAHSSGLDAEPSAVRSDPVWECKIGIRGDFRLPAGCDAPMRRATEAAFLAITGVDPEFIFSGWGSKLTEPELAVVENRPPSETYYREHLVREAAPDLLKACRAMVEACTTAPPMELIQRFSLVADQCAAAIAKAESRS